MHESKSEFAARTELRLLLRTSLDGKDITGGGSADISKQRSSSEDQELEEQSSLCEWCGECLKELALQVSKEEDKSFTILLLKYKNLLRVLRLINLKRVVRRRSIRAV